MSGLRLSGALLLVAGMTACSPPDTPVPQPWASGVTGQWRLGAYAVRLDAAGLRIARDGHPALWQSEGAPLAAARVALRADERRGMVRLQEDGAEPCGAWQLLRVRALRLADADALQLEGRMRCAGRWQDAQLTLREHPAEVGHALALDASLGAGAANRLLLSALSARDERLWGGGMQASRIDWKGAELPIVASEQGVGRGQQPLTLLANLSNQGAGGAEHSSYAALPHWISSAGRSLWVDTHELVRLDARAADRLTLSVHARRARLVLREADTPLQLIQAHSAEVGRMRALPDWVMDGAVIGLQGGSDAVDAKLTRIRAAGVPVAALWLQDWVGPRRTSFGQQLWWNWQLDAAHYPRFAAQRQAWAAQGIRWLGYVNPFLVELPVGDPRRRLFDEARAQGYLLRGADGAPLMSLNTSFSAAHVDLANPAALAWLKQVLKDELLRLQPAGWMADFAESRPFHALAGRMALGGEAESRPFQAEAELAESAMAAHNRWPERWTRLNRELLEESGLTEQGVVFHRSAWSRSPRHATLFWLGDQLVDWSAEDGLASALTGLLSAGLSGMALNHSDIGGYTTLTQWPLARRRTPELFMRWAELAAFTPVMRTHEGNRPEANAQLADDPLLLRHFARMVRLHGCWREERRRLVQEAATRGWPLNRALALHHGGDPAAWQGQALRQMLIGPDLLLAPVLQPGAEQVQVYLPGPGWRHLWSGRDAAPGLSRWPAPLGEPALFVRAGRPAAEALQACAARLPPGPRAGAPADRP